MDNEDGYPNDGGDIDGNDDQNYDGGPIQDGEEGGEGDEGGEDVDQYFDDAGDIGYLPADHVSYQIKPFNSNMFTCSIALNGQIAKCLDKTTDG
jgi:hypothetical protein